jgi:hypothetical protein
MTGVTFEREHHMRMSKLWAAAAASLAFAAACGAESAPASPAQNILAPAGVEVVGVSEEATVYADIAQVKTFDQCDSASPFRAEIQFSDSASEGGEQALVLKAGVTGEIGLPGAARAAVEGAIEQHFAASRARSQGHQEAVAIEVPARIRQRYTIVWREARREGTVRYAADGAEKAVAYSYRTGLELVSAQGKDLPCAQEPSAGGEAEAAPPTSAPPAPEPPAPEPSASPAPPTALPPTPNLDTPPGTVLEPYQTWRQGDLELSLRDVQLAVQGEKGVLMVLALASLKPQAIAVRYNVGEAVEAVDNRGQRLRIGCSSGPQFGFASAEFVTQEALLDPGGRIALEVCHFDGTLGQEFVWIVDDIADPAVTEIVLSVRGIAGIAEARWRIPIPH